MRRLRPLPSACVAALLLAGCGKPSPDTDAAQARMEWQGRQACVDCRGVDTVLVLERSDDLQTYRLTETYLTAGGAEPFVDSGQWRLEAALIRLSSEEGAMRAYAVLGDGSLLERDADGGRLPGEAHVLVPVPGVLP